MPKNKMKSNKAAAKRFSFTATGKIKFKRAGLRHNLSHRTRGQKRGLVKTGYVFEGERTHIERALPYGR